ncbi:LacI family DNA-binding transcriptional regulator [Pelagibius sp. Alg239-R121]|uniref:LacI family DNA-binding transcriptional regulator n=1 Tax=Pelagibius sp. Alg239-R121 TaxID=2993448 RepID=UPI0024A65214|nr:LacI family DNA-binding transcriptional regulator [Pelagibius sp. Alg239-R121]
MVKQVIGVNRRTTGSVGVRQVAKAAGVSTATVSRALNQPHQVSEELRKHVTSVAAELNYIPDPAARALSSQKTFRIGALIPTIANSIYSRFIEALQRRLRESGYSLVIANYDFDEALEMEEARALVESGIDALILAGEHRTPDLYELLATRRIPYLLISIYLPDSPHRCVGYDNRAGAETMARHILELGHREIGVIEGPSGVSDRARLRTRGIRDALNAFDLELPAHRLTSRSFSVRNGREGLSQLLDGAPEITAVICGNDVLAIGALMEAQSRGLNVPEDLSICGFDGLDIAQEMVPQIATMHVPTAQMGLKAAESLVTMLSGEEAPHAVLIETRLVPGGSTAPPKKP